MPVSLNKHSCACFIVLLTAVALTQPARATDSRHSQQQQSGVTWAMQAMAALTGGNQVTSVTESGTVTRTIGEDRQIGTITLQSSGVMNSQLNLATGIGTFSETRSWDGNIPSGSWTGFDGQLHQMAQHNCWTDGVWFFPALSLLADYSDPTLVFVDLGPQEYSGGTVEHLQVYRSFTNLPPDGQAVVQGLSTVNYYLNSQTALPVAIAFKTHGDNAMNADISMAIVFSQYQSVGGIQVPFQITRLLGDTPYLQVNITSAVPNGQGSPARLR